MGESRQGGHGQRSRVQQVAIIHAAVRGRACFGLPGLKHSKSLQDSVELSLSGHPGIERVAANALTGRVLVQFDPEVWQAEAIADLLQNCLQEYRQQRQTEGTPGRRSPPVPQRDAPGRDPG